MQDDSINRYWSDVLFVTVSHDIAQQNAACHCFLQHDLLIHLPVFTLRPLHHVGLHSDHIGGVRNGRTVEAST